MCFAEQTAAKHAISNFTVPMAPSIHPYAHMAIHGGSPTLPRRTRMVAEARRADVAGSGGQTGAAGQEGGGAVNAKRSARELSVLRGDARWAIGVKQLRRVSARTQHASPGASAPPVDFDCRRA